MLKVLLGDKGFYLFFIWHCSLFYHCNIGIVFFLSMLVFCMQVVLAANDLPSINDVTYPELVEIMSKVT